MPEIGVNFIDGPVPIVGWKIYYGDGIFTETLDETGEIIDTKVNGNTIISSAGSPIKDWKGLLEDATKTGIQVINVYHNRTWLERRDGKPDETRTFKETRGFKEFYYYDPGKKKFHWTDDLASIPNNAITFFGQTLPKNRFFVIYNIAYNDWTP